MYSFAHLFTIFLALLVPLLTLAAPVNGPNIVVRPATPPPGKPGNPKILSITFGNGQTYMLLEAKRGAASDAPIWILSDKTRVAKQFIFDRDRNTAKKQRDAFDLELQRSIVILGQARVSGGYAQINLAGDMFGWIVSPTPVGHEFMRQPGWIKVYNLGEVKCQEYLLTTVRPEYERAMVAFHRTNRLVHLGARQPNTVWNKDATKIIEFLDLAPLDIVAGDMYAKVVAQLLPDIKSPHVSVAELASRLARQIYPNRLCKPN